MPVAVAVLIGLVFLIRYAYLWIFRNDALLEQIDALADLQPEQAVSELSVLMRRIAITRYSRVAVASLSDEAWLQFLDDSGDTNQFTEGPGRVLASAPYSGRQPGRLEPLFEVCRNWVKTTAR